MELKWCLNVCELVQVTPYFVSFFYCGTLINSFNCMTLVDCAHAVKKCSLEKQAVFVLKVVSV